MESSRSRQLAFPRNVWRWPATISTLGQMKRTALTFNHRWRERLVALLAIVSVGFWLREARAGESSVGDASATVPQNALGQALSTQEQNQLIGLIRAANLPDLRWPGFGDYRDQVMTFYEAGAYSLAWVSKNQPTPQALALIQVFKAAAQNGLNRED